MNSIQQSASHSFNSSMFSFADVFTASGYGVYLFVANLVNAIKHATGGSKLNTIPTASPSLGNYVRLKEEADSSNEASLTLATTTKNGYTRLQNEAETIQPALKQVTFARTKKVIHSSKPLLKKAADQNSEQPLVRQSSKARLPTTNIPFLQRMRIGMFSKLPLEKVEQQARLRLDSVPVTMQAVKEATTPQQFQHAQISLQSLLYLLFRVYNRVSDAIILKSNPAVVRSHAQKEAADKEGRKLTPAEKEQSDAISERHEDLVLRYQDLEFQMRQVRTVLKAQFVETGTILKKLINEQINLVEARTKILEAAMVSGKKDLRSEESALHKDASTLVELTRRSKVLALDCRNKMQKTDNLGDAHETYSLLTETMAQVAKFLGRANMLLPKELQLSETTVNGYTKNYSIELSSPAKPKKEKKTPSSDAAPTTKKIKSKHEEAIAPMKGIDTQVKHPNPLYLNQVSGRHDSTKLKAHKRIGSAA